MRAPARSRRLARSSLGDHALSWTSKSYRQRTLRRLATCAAFASVAIAFGAIGHSRAAGETRTITFFNIHNNETTTIAFKKDGQFIPGALD